MAAAEVFMDSAGFLALWDAGDEHHPAAVRLQDELVRKRRRFLTSDYVVDESEYYYREFSLKKAYPMGINIVVHALSH